MAKPLQKLAAAAGARGANAWILTRSGAPTGPRGVAPGVRTASFETYLGG